MEVWLECRQLLLTTVAMLAMLTILAILAILAILPLAQLHRAILLLQFILNLTCFLFILCKGLLGYLNPAVPGAMRLIGQLIAVTANMSTIYIHVCI